MGLSWILDVLRNPSGAKGYCGMISQTGRPTFQDSELQHEIMQLRKVDNYTNLLYLTMEYLSLAIVIGGAIVFSEYRQVLGLSWYTNLPVFASR